jgi:DNA-binding protein H-NS
MARKSLRPHLNQVRTWVRQGRTDAWIAHQLEVTVQQIQSFKRENELAPADNGSDLGEVDLRAEDDALIAAELEAEAEAKATADAEAEAEAKAEAERRAAAGEDDEADEADEDATPKPRRARRSRSRKAPAGPLEGSFDHGEEGYGLWLDPAVADDPIYAEHWAGHRPVVVTIEADQIVIRRSGDDPDADDA